MKNFLLADSSELMVVRLISASLSPQNVWFLPSRHNVRRVDKKIFFSPIRASWWLLDSFRASWAPKTFDSYFLTWFTSCSWKIFFSPIRANFWLLDSFRPPEPREVCLTFGTRCTSSAWKIFFSPIRASWWLLDSFRPPEPKNVWFLLSRHNVRRLDEKFSSRRFERADGC